MSSSENTVNNLDNIMHTLVTTSSVYLLEKKRNLLLDKLKRDPTYLKNEDVDNLSGDELRQELNKRILPGRNEDLELLNDRDFVLSIIDCNANILEHCSTEIKEDKEIVLKCVSVFSANLQYAGQELKNDQEVVITAIKKNANHIKYASEDVCDDKGFALKALKFNCDIFKYLSQNLKSDKDVVLAAVRNYGWNLSAASNELKNDPYVVLAAVKNMKTAFNAASQEIIDMYDGENPKEFLEQYIEKLELYKKINEKIDSTIKEVDKTYKKIKI